MFPVLQGRSLVSKWTKRLSLRPVFYHFLHTTMSGVKFLFLNYSRCNLSFAVVYRQQIHACRKIAEV